MKYTKTSFLLQRPQGIRLWFEFLKLAHEDSRPEVKKALKDHADYYQPWGDVRGQKFDAWWKEHAVLFTESEGLELLTDAPTTLKLGHLYLAIPTSRSLTKTMADIKAVLSEALKSAQAVSRKHKTKIGARYRLSEGAEVRVNTLQADLVVYRDVYLKLSEPRRVNEDLVHRIHAYYAARKRAKRAPSQFGNLEDLKRRSDAALESHIRTLRRSIKRAERLVLNAAKGDFPGRGS